MVSPDFRGDGWHLSPAEQTRASALLAKHGITSPAPAATTPAAAPPASSAPADTFAPAADPSAYRIHWPLGAFGIAADPAITAALGATNSVAANTGLQAAFRSGAVAMGLPAKIGGSVIESALEDMSAYQSMTDAERQLHDAEQQAAFSRFIGKDDLAAAKQAVAALVSKWHAKSPALVEALVSRGLFKNARAFAHLHQQSRRGSKST
jgi:hypothetical protein